MSYNFLDKTGLTYFWSKIKAKFDSFSRNDLAVLGSKEYSGIYGSANDQAGASFYFATVRPNNFYQMWRIKFRVYSNVPNQNEYIQYSDVEYYGNKSDIGFVIFNRIANTSGRCYYFNNMCRLSLTGYNAGYSHILGMGLRGSNNPTSSSYPRHFKIELLETENCTFTFYDTMKKIANISEYNTTNYSGITEYDGYNNGLRETGDDTNIWQLRHNAGNYVVSTALYRYMICLQKNETTLIPMNAVNNSTATTKALTTDTFNPFGQIVYYNSTTTVNANASVGASALFEQAQLDLRYSFNAGTTLTSHKDVYMVAVPQSNGMAKLHSTPIKQTLPTTEDGLIYIHLGRAYSNYQIELFPVHLIYEYKNGSLRLYTNNTTYSDVTTTTHGLMTAADKVKLNGIAEGATANVGTITGVSINGTSIATSGVANIVTNTAYNSSTNTIATMTDVVNNRGAENPIATILAYAGSEAPTGYLMCDGSAVNRTTYSELYNVIGTQYGTGDGSTTFNVPDLQGKVIAGLDIVDSNFNVLGKTGGSKSVQLTKNQLPQIYGRIIMHSGESATNIAQMVGDFTSSLNNANKYRAGGSEASGAKSIGDIILNVGKNEAHNNLQPYNTLNYIIKAYSGTDVPIPVELSSVKNVYDNSTSNVYTTAKANSLFGDITVLYDNPTNASVTNISLSDSAANYEKIRVFYNARREDLVLGGSTELYSCNNKYFTLDSGVQPTYDNNAIKQCQTTFYVSNSSISLYKANGWEIAASGATAAVNHNNYIYISRVEGIHKN